MIFIFGIAGVVLAAGWYFGIRYFLLERGLKEAAEQLQEIGGSPEQNRILRLPFPDRGLGRLMEAVNELLEEMRRERLSYERREKAFQEQIENISHDLRTPLTVILGYLKITEKSRDSWAQAWKEARQTRWAEAWQKETGGKAACLMTQDEGFRQLWKETAENMEAVERNARILEKLVAQFYLYSQITAGDYEMETENLDACRILRESLADNYGILERLSLKAELPEQSVPVMGNRESLERIFRNLLQNAGRYAGSRLEIRMEERSREQICFLFENDGAEITEDELLHIFDRFYKGSRAGNREGSGLGLAIARTLAEKMGGMLTAEIPEEKYRLRFLLFLTKAQDLRASAPRDF